MAEKEDEVKLSLPERVFADRVRSMREAQGWSQNDLAEKLRALGLDYVTQATVSRIEKMTRPVRMSESVAIAEIFGTTAIVMMTPDPRFEYLADIRERSRASRKRFGAYRMALYETIRNQVIAQDDLVLVLDMFGLGEGLNPEIYAFVKNIELNLGNFAHMDIEADARAIIQSARSGKPLPPPPMGGHESNAFLGLDDG